jgi:pre-mRNA cleavage complex 2 protein Pcf11
VCIVGSLLLKYWFLCLGTLNIFFHRIRLGAPTRELYVDGKWYECCFGGPPVTVEIGGKMHMARLEGPPPQVKIGLVKRTDLVAGKINLIINAKTMVPVYLDATSQR